MGRGRQKAKHQKVARELKYHTSTIDTSALERELSSEAVDHSYGDQYDGDEDDDPYAAYSADDED